MKTFLVLLQNKSITLLKNDLFVEHVQHLEQLINAENLVMHGLFSDDSGAIRVIQGKAQPEVDSLIQADAYCGGYSITEFYSAHRDNHYLMAHDQTIDEINRGALKALWFKHERPTAALDHSFRNAKCNNVSS
jgi:uncharacterized protein YciI